MIAIAVLLLDDDTELGHDFFIRHDLLEDERKLQGSPLEIYIVFW